MPTPTLLLATRNRHKAAEIQCLLGVACRSLLDYPAAPQLVENGSTFADNARAKALQLARWLSPARATADLGVNAVLADDSGLEVDALAGAPGVRSARFAAEAGQENADDRANNEKLLRLLEGVPLEHRTARFRCALALTRLPWSENDEPKVFEGSCEGLIAFAPAGHGGFGYDPLFIPHGHNRSFAELGEQIKNRISHRARALAKLRAWLTQCAWT